MEPPASAVETSDGQHRVEVLPNGSSLLYTKRDDGSWSRPERRPAEDKMAQSHAARQQRPSTHDESGQMRYSVSSRDPARSHVCVRWWECRNAGKMCGVCAVLWLVVLGPLLILFCGLACHLACSAAGDQIIVLQAALFH